MKRLMLLVAAGSLWLFLAAVPALADGGPHVSSVNSGTSSLTADSCAGCHRAHTASSEYLLAATSEEALCLSCHGAGVGAGATTDVEAGIQYVPLGDGTASAVVLGALRDGGFITARIGTDSATRVGYYRSATDVSQRPKVPAAAAGSAVTSAHIALAAGVESQGRVWGSTLSGTGASPVELTCVECHNPHGNGQYRILKPVPGIDANQFGAQVTLDVVGTYDLMDYIKTDTQHGLVVNDTVVLTGVNGLTGTYYVRSVPNGFIFTISSSLGGAVVNLTTSTGGSAIRTAGSVTDSAVDPDGDGSNPTKNYTIMQTKGSQGMDASFLLYARDVTAALGAGQFDPIVTSVTSVATSNWITTTAAHGLTVGDRVTLASVPGIADGTYTVSSVQSSGTLYNQFKVFGQTATIGAAAGTVTRNAITGTFSAVGGDYFRRSVPWNPALQNASCDNSIYNASGTLGAAACGTMNDAPNGRPSAIIAGTGVPTALVGQKAFLDEMSTWCAACHTRYYSASNENIGEEPVISTLNASVTIAAASANFVSAGSNPAFGDRVTFTGMADAALNAGQWYVIYTATGQFRVSATLDGAAYTATLATTTGGAFTKVYQSSNSSWGYPRYDGATEDPTYKYQHSTASNRACTVCHVGHGSNAVMTGEGGTTFAANYPYPDGTLNDSSRLLKVDNRGTCQMCHDPTGTVPAGTSVGAGNTSIP